MAKKTAEELYRSRVTLAGAWLFWTMQATLCGLTSLLQWLRGYPLEEALGLGVLCCATIAAPLIILLAAFVEFTVRQRFPPAV